VIQRALAISELQSSAYSFDRSANPRHERMDRQKRVESNFTCYLLSEALNLNSQFYLPLVKFLINSRRFPNFTFLDGAFTLGCEKMGTEKLNMVQQLYSMQLVLSRSDSLLLNVSF
jgi:hypothetical protein